MSDSALKRYQSAPKWIFWIGVFVAGFLIVFWNEVQIVLNRGLVSEEYSYVLLLPFVFGYMVYRKRGILDALESLPDRRLGDLWTVVGLSLMLTTFVAYFYVSETTYALEWRLLMVPFFVSGMVLAVFGYRFWRQIAIPIAFLVFFEPYFIEVTNPYWALLANLSAIGAHDLLSTLGYSNQLTTSLTGPVIQTVSSQGTVYVFDLGVGSSLFGSLAGYTLFALLVAYLLSGSPAKRLGLVVLSFPLLLGVNVVRTAGIIGLTNFVGQTAERLFLLTGGLFLIFVGTILLLFIGQRFLRLMFEPALARSGPVASTGYV